MYFRMYHRLRELHRDHESIEVQLLQVPIYHPYRIFTTLLKALEEHLSSPFNFSVKLVGLKNLEKLYQTLQTAPYELVVSLSFER